MTEHCLGDGNVKMDKLESKAFLRATREKTQEAAVASGSPQRRGIAPQQGPSAP